MDETGIELKPIRRKNICLQIDRNELSVDKVDENDTIYPESAPVERTLPWFHQNSRKGLSVKRSVSFKAIKTNTASAKISLVRNVEEFFGLLKDDEAEQRKWRQRSCRLHREAIIGGNIKPQHDVTVDSVFDSLTQLPIQEPAKDLTDGGDNLDSSARFSSNPREAFFPSRQVSRISTASSGRRSQRSHVMWRHRQESVMQMAFDSFRNLVVQHEPRKSVLSRRSFAPSSISSTQDDESRSPVPDAVWSPDELDDVFFNEAIPTSPFADSAQQSQPEGQSSIINLLPTIVEDRSPLPSSPDSIYGDAMPSFLQLDATVSADDLADGSLSPSYAMGWQDGRKRPKRIKDTPEFDEIRPFQGMRRMVKNVVEKSLQRSDRHDVGVGLIGRLFSQSYKIERLNSDINEQLDDIDDHRPFFTYWVTFVQIAIFLISVAVYGIAPFGIQVAVIKSEVMKSSLAILSVSYFERENLWIGPRQADLVHMGAKYSPCMRKDANVEAAIFSDRQKENATGCCVRNDGSGCVQAHEHECSETLSTFLKWREDDPNMPGSNGRVSGAVCGQDPRSCINPSSRGAFSWPDDITLWPTCREAVAMKKQAQNLHLTCEVVGRPCCIGIQGECIITTRQHCNFMRGYFHEKNALCSQISCMDEICGMMPFYNPDYPDHIYRLWTSLFVHAGLLQLMLSVMFQILFMRDMEKLAGCIRIGIIYMGSGICGSLSSAIFLPYHVEAGPAGAQFGLLACMFVETIQNWGILQRPWWVLGKLTLIVIFLFIIGLLPFVDNWAHLVGFIFGFLLSFALLPYVTLGKQDRTNKLIGIVFCLFTAVSLFSLLIILFYVSPIYHCPNCQYFNCLPFTDKFCDAMEVKIRRKP